MLVAVTGMQREAKLLRGRCQVVVAGGKNLGLGSKIEHVIARGAHAIMSFGIAGGLDPSLQVGDVIIASEVFSFDDELFPTDGKWLENLRAALPDTKMGRFAGSDVLALEPMLKESFYHQSHAMIVDAESHIAARTAQQYGVPFVGIRAVSDDARQSLPPAAAFALNDEGRIDYSAVMLSLLDEPSQWRALIRTARDTNTAMKALLRCLELLGPGLGCPPSS